MKQLVIYMVRPEREHLYTSYRHICIYDETIKISRKRDRHTNGIEISSWNETKTLEKFGRRRRIPGIFWGMRCIALDMATKLKGWGVFLMAVSHFTLCNSTVYHCCMYNFFFLLLLLYNLYIAIDKGHFR